MGWARTIGDLAFINAAGRDIIIILTAGGNDEHQKEGGRFHMV
jgi:hypothetical protein